jgi:hypothetical protein
VTNRPSPVPGFLVVKYDWNTLGRWTGAAEPGVVADRAGVGAFQAIGLLSRSGG